MKVKHQLENRRFELIDEKNHRWGEMNYILRDHILNITHVGVHESHRGEGLGDLLVESGIDFAKKENLKIHPICTFAVHYLKKHQQYDDLIQW